MIAFVKGSLADVESDRVIIDVGGIGYNVFVSSYTMGRLPLEGNEVKLYTYLNVKEDLMQLYGFLSKDELRIFKLLIGVNGIGPKGALGILSAMTADDLRFAIIAGDSKAIAKAPGIGAKSAERIILDLKDKITFEPDSLSETDMSVSSSGSIDSTAKNEAIEAMSALGYSPAEALKAVKQIEITPDMDAGAILKAALKVIR